MVENFGHKPNDPPHVKSSPLPPLTFLLPTCLDQRPELKFADIVWKSLEALLMGAPKQKWTAAEEDALKAGVRKHGTGKWRTILMDPEFSSLLRLRSNVDLKDKWRNINVTAIWGSRQKAKLALKKNPQTPKKDSNPKAISTVVKTDEEITDAKPLAICSGTPRNGGSKEISARVDNLILEAITTLKEPGGSDKASIVKYIEENYWSAPNLTKLLAAKLKLLTTNGKLIKVKHRYKIAPSSAASEGKRNSSVLLLEGKQMGSLKSETGNIRILTKGEVDQELAKMRSMSAQEAAAAAAKAVAEAEAAMAEAEKAAQEADEAEAEAEAAQIFAKAVMKAYKYRTRHT